MHPGEFMLWLASWESIVRTQCLVWSGPFDLGPAGARNLCYAMLHASHAVPQFRPSRAGDHRHRTSSA